jgi:hypothetical protein
MLIISAFPGTGKSYFHEKFPHVADSDSSQFDKRYFPSNYLTHIQNRYERGLCTFVSSHEAVRKSIISSGLPFMLVYPAKECKAEYLERYRLRGSPQAFIDLIDANWDAWLDGCAAEQAEHVVLKPGQYLSDVIQWGFSLK